MIITVAQAKEYLRLEPQFTEDDSLIQTFVDASEAYLVNATGRSFDSTNPLARLLCLVLVADWYENREMIGKVSEKVRFTVESIMSQLQHCYITQGASAP